MKSEDASKTQVIKVVVFDLGKVLLDFDYGIVAWKLAQQSKASLRQIQTFISQSPWLIRYEKGLINSEQLFQEIRGMSGYQGSLEEFSAMFSDVFTPIEPMIELKEHLTASGVPTFIFSNTNELAIQHIRATYPFYNNFDGYVLSFEHGFMKPESQLYDIVESTAGHSGASICYIDDRKENVAEGVGRGWVTILHRSVSDSMRALRQAGLPA